MSACGSTLSVLRSWCPNSTCVSWMNLVLINLLRSVHRLIESIRCVWKIGRVRLRTAYERCCSYSEWIRTPGYRESKNTYVAVTWVQVGKYIEKTDLPNIGIRTMFVFVEQIEIPPANFSVFWNPLGVAVLSFYYYLLCSLFYSITIRSVQLINVSVNQLHGTIIN